MKSWEITKKDIRLLVRDARALFVLLVLPMVFITIIGLTMGKLFGWRNTNQILQHRRRQRDRLRPDRRPRLGR